MLEPVVGPLSAVASTSRMSAEISRRRFMQAGTAALAGADASRLLAAVASASQPRASIRHCITLFLVGSPGQLDTWDMKPEAPSEIRGRFRPIATNVPGIEICEHFPQMARIADRFALVRSLHHAGPALHETGQRYMMTGDDFNPSEPRPMLGSVLSRVYGRRSSLPAAMILPQPLGDTGAGPWHGQTAGYLGREYDPRYVYADDSSEGLLPGSTVELRRALDLSQEPELVRERYGRHPFGQSCLLARRLIERGVRSVTVNQFSSLFDTLSWDMHANGSNLNVTFDDYERYVCPQFDQAYTALILDLEQRGLLAETVVPVLSEMGRTPRINRRGGRDHHPGVWTNFIAGGPIRGGQVIGSSDKFGASPHDRPVTPAQMLATIYRALGVDLDTATMPGPDGLPIRLIDAEPIAELF
jgi:hypothetical protein